MRSGSLKIFCTDKFISLGNLRTVVCSTNLSEGNISMSAFYKRRKFGESPCQKDIEFQSHYVPLYLLPRDGRMFLGSGFKNCAKSTLLRLGTDP